MCTLDVAEVDAGGGSVSTTSTVAPGISRALSLNMSVPPVYVTIMGDSESVQAASLLVKPATLLGLSPVSTGKNARRGLAV